MRKMLFAFTLILMFSTALAACLFESPPRDPNSFHELAARTLDYGIWCFGHDKKDCLARTGNEPILSIPLDAECDLAIHYIALVDIIIIAGIIVFFTERNPWPLIITIIITGYFFIF